MGKTTIAQQFAQAGARVSNADAMVHKLLKEDYELIDQIAQYFPQAMLEGKVDRQLLGKQVFADKSKLQKLEALLHPKVRAENLRLIEQAKSKNWPLLVLEIPLLYETGAEEICDAVVVVSCGEKMQRERVLARDGMTEEKLEQILSRQMPDEEKRARADYIIDTSNGLEDSKAQVEALISNL